MQFHTKINSKRILINVTRKKRYIAQPYPKFRLIASRELSSVGESKASVIVLRRRKGVFADLISEGALLSGETTTLAVSATDTNTHTQERKKTALELEGPPAGRKHH